MQISWSQPDIKPGTAVTALLWLGLAAAGTWLLQKAASAPPLGMPIVIAILTLFVAAVASSFSLRYMRADTGSKRFFLILGALVAAVLTLLCSGNLLVLATGWCASGLLLAELIGHSAGWSEAKAAARRARLAFAAGDTALFAALGILAWQTGSLNIDTVLSGAGKLHPAVAAAVALLLVVSAGIRCALPPFSGWLLSSMTAPTPVSALMHAGLVNAGGFLLIRFAPVIEGAPMVRMAAIVFGLFGAIYGIGIMMVRPDVKRSLAGSTVSQMGFMIMSCGLGAYSAALWHIVAHGLFKAWLFLGSGSAIGMKGGRAAAPISGKALFAIAAGTMATALAILSFGVADASLVPLLLAVATAAATLAASLGGKLPLKAKLTLLLLVALLVAFHSAGLAMAHVAVGADASAVMPDWVLLTLLVSFLAAWLWQQQRLSNGSGLPVRLYVHLINAGALGCTGKGEAK